MALPPFFLHNRAPNAFEELYVKNEAGEFVKFDPSGGGDVSVSWDDVTNKPAVIASGENQADAREAIGAGTSNLVIGTGAGDAKAGNYTPPAGSTTVAGLLQIGTTATTAAAGNHNHAVTADSASGLAAAANIQALAVALSTRIKALEDATP